MAKPKDEQYVERDDSGNITGRSHDTIPVKIHGSVQDIPRRTERAALDNAAFGDSDKPETPEEREMRLVKEGALEYCVKCGRCLPADREHFRNDSSVRKGWRQPCKPCWAELARRRYWENSKYGNWRRSGKFRKSDSGGG